MSQGATDDQHKGLDLSSEDSSIEHVTFWTQHSSLGQLSCTCHHGSGSDSSAGLAAASRIKPARSQGENMQAQATPQLNDAANLGSPKRTLKSEGTVRRSRRSHQPSES
eukprot:1467230-Amphidinium_carterae.1